MFVMRTASNTVCDIYFASEFSAKANLLILHLKRHCTLLENPKLFPSRVAQSIRVISVISFPLAHFKMFQMPKQQDMYPVDRELYEI